MSLFNKMNLKQFETLKYIADNADTPHVTCIIKCMIQSDKIETPYYMDISILVSHCVENHEKDIVHAMDVFNHHRMYNLTDKKHSQLKKLMIDTFMDVSTKTMNVDFSKNRQIVEIKTLNASKLKSTLNEYETFFKTIDNLV